MSVKPSVSLSSLYWSSILFGCFLHPRDKGTLKTRIVVLNYIQKAEEKTNSSDVFTIPLRDMTFVLISFQALKSSQKYNLLKNEGIPGSDHGLTKWDGIVWAH